MRIARIGLLLPLLLIYLSFTNIEIQEKGVKNSNDLPDIVFHAMKSNDFEQIVNYIPGENELDYLKENTPKKSKHLFDQTDSEGLKAESKISFEKAIEAGVHKQINWGNAEILESGIEKIDSPDKRISKGWFIVQDRKEVRMKVSFDVIKIKNKWFAFREFKVDN